MAEIVIIGGGRLGTSLGRALAANGHSIRAVTCRRKRSAEESRAIIGQGKAMKENEAAARLGKVIFLCLPDEETARVALRLARSRLEWAGKTVFHTSGLLSSRVLEPLKDKGARTASLHPAQAFSGKRTPPSHFRGITFGIEGDKVALTLARRFVRQLGARAVVIPADAKPLYHTALSFASNFLVVLVDAAAGLLGQAKIPENKAAGILFPLIQGTLRNVKNLDTAWSMTGPLVRGDAATVGAHIDALRRLPQCRAAYKALSLLGVELARRSGLPAKKVRALKSRLGGR